MEILTKMEFELMEAMHVFSLYNSAIKDMPWLDPLHKVGHQALTAGAVQMAAEVFERYKDRYFAMFPRNEDLPIPDTHNPNHSVYDFMCQMHNKKISPWEYGVLCYELGKSALKRITDEPRA